MIENIFDTDLKYECKQFWKEFIMWMLVMVILTIIFKYCKRGNHEK